MKQRQRTLLITIMTIVVAWLMAWTGYTLAKRSKMTAQRVYAFQNSIDWSRLSAAERAKALQRLVDMLNALAPDERHKWIMDRDWFRQLTEEEKTWFIEAYLPGEMKRALALFERQPKEKQQRDIDEALKDMQNRAANSQLGTASGGNGTNAPLVSPELDQKIRTMGLNALYSESSAQTKAEMAPLLMEVQRQFESGSLDFNGF
jgi:hypothetical protein